MYKNINLVYGIGSAILSIAVGYYFYSSINPNDPAKPIMNTDKSIDTEISV